MATLVEVDLDVACCCDRNEKVGYGEIVDDRRSFQNCERIVECSKLGANCVVTESAIVNMNLDVSDGEIGEVVVKSYDVEKVNRSENMELLLKGTESVEKEKDVEVVQTMKENVEVIENGNKSEFVVMKNVDDEQPVSVAEQTLKTEATNDPIVTANAVSQFVEDYVDDEQPVNVAEQPLKSEATDDPIVAVNAVSQFVEDYVDETQPNIQQKVTAENIEVAEHKDGTEIENCDDGEQTQSADKEDVIDQLTLTFPASFVSLDNINIQFGSFGDTKSALKVANPETESECGSNINNQELVLIDLQELDKNVTCEGVDDIDDDQREDDDERLKEQIKNAQMQLDEKRRRREVIKAEMHIKFGSMIVYREAFKAKNLKLRAAMQSVKSKREQIDQVQCDINKIKNTIAVEDIDSRIYKVEHMIKNGQLFLEGGKQLTREIKHLKIMRVQLASNMCSPDEIQHALDEKDQKEELLKNLNTELKTLKYEVSKAQVACDTIRKKYVEEHEMERELRAQFIAAEESCREAKGHLHSLKKKLSDKNKSFHMYEKEPMLARRSASCREEVALHHVGTKQVERFIDKRSTNDECNMFATHNTNTQDEPSCVFPDDTDESIASNSGPIPDEVKSTSAVTNLELEQTVKSVEERHSDGQIKENVVEEFEQMVKNKEPNEPTKIVDIEEKEKTVELVQEQIEAKLKEKIRLEEKVKVSEAHDRKKRNAEKAQTWADMLAQKEAQQREKARLKRLRRKERKRAAGDDAATSTATRCSIDNVDEGIAESNKSKEIENTNAKPQQHPPPPHFLPKQLKPKFTPPPLAVAAAIRNRKRWPHWGNMVITVIVLILSVISFRSIDLHMILRSRLA